ncbi:MAG: DUF4097 family beta strand repeat-containing protein [Thermoleophilia bacterium]
MRARRIAPGAAAAFVVAATAWALVQAVAAPTDRDRARVAGVPAAVAVEVDQGDVTVRAEEGRDAVAAEADVRAVVAPDSEAVTEDGEARLSWRCRLWTTCRADLVARVPAGVDVRAETAFGDVVVLGPVGDVDLEAGSGEVRADAIGGSRATVSARSGDVVLRFTAAPREVEVEASSGDVTIRVPAGAYRIEAETGAGDVSLRGVRHDPDAGRSITVDTSAGDVRIAAS